MLANDGLLDYIAPDGHLILSGILREQEAEIARAVVKAGGAVKRVENNGDWIAVLAIHADR